MNDSNLYDVTQDQEGKPLPHDDAVHAKHPERIGRYRIEKVLGKGGFGLVYLAHDEQLARLVAIKVPHARLISQPEDAKEYLAEARTVASLDHPAIVPVHDVGSTANCPCFVVSKYIEGTDLATKLKESRPNYREAAALVATVAEALHYAHKQGLVHRDVKPGNILIDGEGKPFVVDFGLALREENIGKGPKYAGTPAYMSPEQARGEGHRVDGRSDIFSLGVVLYELLAGRQPFRCNTRAELFEQVTSYEAKPLRQYDEKLPKELERICHKAMAKRASERYSSAHDMAEDLRMFLQVQTVIQAGTSKGAVSSVASETQASQAASTSVGSVAVPSASIGSGSLDSQPIKIVPKGLRSFDAHDADFFLELLPGPRDRDGLPDSLRFWKTRIEETDPDNTFSVGLIYGPSGCGKSSLVKAGLLPRLSEDVIPVYIEATPEETETRLLNGLRKRCSSLEDNSTLKDTLAALRKGQGIPVGKKVLIVLDQFEQWLHAYREVENTDLVQALRQCDGGRVQCIVMVRDDFWLAVSRFLRELEVRLLEGHNIALADLFDLDHARKVLAAFGRAFGKLPENISDTTKEQTDFLKQSAAGLAEEGKVICVRLALFAEMMKGKSWTPATLKQVGGTKGVGVTFLEETFSSSTASPEHRYHQNAARAVLKSLLPDSGTDIKGTMRSYAELLEASGYRSRPRDFDELIRILDSEIRLITPTDPEGKDAGDDSVRQTKAGQKYFQLTHDYLVPSLRDWLTRKQKETRKGRAELKLFDTCATWNAKPENRFLPSWWEHLTIRLLTDKRKWTEPQRKMMGKAGRVHGIRSILVLVALMAVVLGGITVRKAVNERQRDAEATRLVEGLLQAETTQVKSIIGSLADYREYAKDELNKSFAESLHRSNAKLHAALAILPEDNSVLPFLKERLLTVSSTQFEAVRDSLEDHKSQLVADYWEIAQDENQIPSRRLNAACALASYDPSGPPWKTAARFVTQHLTSAVPPVDLGHWRHLFHPSSGQLTDTFVEIHAERHRSDKQREAAAYFLSAYLTDNPNKLLDVILVADELPEFSLLLDTLRPHATTIRQRLLDEVQATMPPELNKLTDNFSQQDRLSRITERRDAFWRRQSLAAVTLIQLGFDDDRVWQLLNVTPAPSLRSFVIYHLGKLQTNHQLLAAKLNSESDVSIRRALIQSLGGLNAAMLPATERNRITEQLKLLYINDVDSGIHSSASWTLRQWGVPLPELTVGEPTLSDLQKARIEKLSAGIEEIRQRITTYEQAELPVRQAVWERQLQEQAATLPDSLSEGLIAHYPLNESDGAETANVVDGQPSGVYAGPGQPEWVPGVIGNAVRLDGKGGHFDCRKAFNPERTDAFSYGCWFLSDNDQYAALLAKTNDDNSYRGFDLWVEDGRLGVHLIHHEAIGNEADDRVKVLSNDPASAGSWHHVMITFDGSSNAKGIMLYVDGEMIGVRAEANSLSGSIQNDVPLHIGMRDRRFPFRGAIDDVRIYSRRLSDEDVRLLYTAGMRALVGVPSESRTPQQQAFLSAAFRSRDETLRTLQTQLAAAKLALRDVIWKECRRWYINGQGQTMVTVPMQTTKDNRQLNYRIAVSSHEVTVAEARKCNQSYFHSKDFSALDDCPVNGWNWFKAAEYCNWLSQAEGIPEDQWVYLPNSMKQYGSGMKIKEDFLKLTGYRLPTDEEWKNACLAGTVGRYCFGEPVELLKQYGWYSKNSAGISHSVESLLPNEFGLFDCHGNITEYVQPTSPLPIQANDEVYWRGGVAVFSSRDASSDVREKYLANQGAFIIGFRVVRTMPPLTPSNGE